MYVVTIVFECEAFDSFQNYWALHDLLWTSGQIQEVAKFMKYVVPSMRVTCFETSFSLITVYFHTFETM
jgi:hypothetical protein